MVKDRPSRERILYALARTDTAADVRAQANFYGRPAMIGLGFAPSALDKTKEMRRQGRAVLRSEFTNLGFSLGRNQFIPNVAMLASHAGVRPLYDFIYHATSTTVHFKPGQLMRGVWGKPGKMRIDLAPVEARLADFGVYWGVRLFHDTLIAALPLTERDDTNAGLDADLLNRAIDMLSDGERLFVLPDELDWPEH